MNDSTDIQRLAQDLGAATFKTTVNAQRATERTAADVKDDARRLISGRPHAQHYPRSISYEMRPSLHQIAADIGPEKDGPQGALGNILEYGTLNNAPIPHLGPALKANEQSFVQRIADAAGEFL